MPRYLVERTFPGGLQIPATDEGERAHAGWSSTAMRMWG